MMPVDNSSYSDPEYRSKLDERMKRLAESREREEIEYSEFLTDARNSAKLNDWEVGFIKTLKEAHSRGLLLCFDDLSEKQKEVAKRIQKKIYRIG